MKIFASQLTAATFASPLATFAQTNAPLTRAEVRADLVRIEQAAHSPSAGDNTNYPDDIQAAEAKIASSDSQRLTNDAIGGTTMSGTSSAGHAKAARSTASSCVGPAIFCNVYFGS
jgi:hypothetical protein